MARQHLWPQKDVADQRSLQGLPWTGNPQVHLRSLLQLQGPDPRSSGAQRPVHQEQLRLRRPGGTDRQRHGQREPRVHQV